MNLIGLIGGGLFIISGIISGISLFGSIYNKISKVTSKELSDIAFAILCVSGGFLWSFLILTFSR